MNRAQLRIGPAQSLTLPEFKPFWQVKVLGDNEGEIYFWGEICREEPVDFWTGQPLEGLFITPKGFLEDLEKVRDLDHITLKINSNGGDMYTSIAICQELQALKAHKVADVAVALSGGSVLLCAADEVRVRAGSMVMIHGPSAGICGYFNIQELKEVIKSQEAGVKAITDIYCAKSGVEFDTMKSMVMKTTWMTGQQIVDHGLADVMVEDNDLEVAMVGKEVLMVNGVQHSLSGLTLPRGLKIKQVPKQLPAAAPAGIETQPDTSAGDKTQGGKTVMANTPEELRAECPDLVAKIEEAAKTQALADAAASERQRIKEIDEISVTIGDAELVAAAKYGESPVDAKTLAFQAMQKHASLGQKVLADMQSDAAASGVSDVAGVPNAGTEKPALEQEVSAAIAGYNMSKGRA